MNCLKLSMILFKSVEVLQPDGGNNVFIKMMHSVKSAVTKVLNETFELQTKSSTLLKDWHTTATLYGICIRVCSSKKW